MAKLRGTLIAQKSKSSGNASKVSRLSNKSIFAHLTTYSTTAMVQIFSDGVVQIVVLRKGEVVFKIVTEPESSLEV